MPSHREVRSLGILLACWFAVNLATLERSPTVWHDEVMFAEPAVRFLQGHGFTVTSWPAPAGTPGILNGPLHSLLLVPWLAVWGVGPVAARSLGLVLTAVTVVLLWHLAATLGVVRSGAWRLLGAGVLLCASGMAWGYRTGRYDPLGMLLAAGLAWAVGRDVRGQCVGLPSGGGPDHGPLPSDLRPPPAVRHGIVAFPVAAAIPFAGLHLIPCIAFLAAALVVLRGRSAVRPLVPVALGTALGGGLLVALHAGLGTWPATAAFIASQRASWSERLAGLPSGLCADPSTLPLLGLLLCLVPACRRIPALRAPVFLGLAGGVAVPVWMSLAGRYPPYYAWMTFVPLLAAVLRAVDVVAGAGSTVVAATSGQTDEGPEAPDCGLPTTDYRPRTTDLPLPDAGARFIPAARHLSWLAVTALAASAVVGLPLRLTACVLEWPQRDYAPVQRFVDSWLRPEDVALTGWEAYYAVTRRCRETLVAGEGLSPGSPSCAAVTVLVTGGDWHDQVGPPDEQTWVRVASYASPAYSLPVRLGDTRWYELSVWRRR